jgi:hypothetical protein
LRHTAAVVVENLKKRFAYCHILVMTFSSKCDIDLKHANDSPNSNVWGAPVGVRLLYLHAIPEGILVPMKKSLYVVVALALIALSSAAFAAPLHSAQASVQLNAQLNESISVVSNNPAVNFNLTPGAITAGDAPMSFNTSWTLAAARHDVYLDAYFSDPSQALVGQFGGTTDIIPSSEVFGLVTPGVGTPAGKQAFTGTSLAGEGGAGVDLQIFDQPITLANLTGTRADTVALSIDLTGNPNLPAEQYTGTLTIVASAL